MKLLLTAIVLLCTGPVEMQDAPLRVGVHSDVPAVTADVVALLKSRGAAAREVVPNAAGLKDLDALVLHRSGFTALPEEFRADLEAFKSDPNRYAGR